jgi:hypothetical protein
MAEEKLGWTEQRIIWNKEGQCAREACRAPLINPRYPNITYVHKDSLLKYCRRCAFLINSHNNEILVEEKEV